MPDKIKSKDLQYDSSLPPFLQRLHDRNAGRGDADRPERAFARPKKAKDPNEDDGPTVVDESGETLTKEEVAKLQRTQSPADTENVTGDTDPLAEPMASGALPDGEPAVDSKRTEHKVTDGTAQKKRKAAKIIGDDENETVDGAKGEKSTVTKVAKKAKKKTKPVKLAFDEDEGP